MITRSERFKETKKTTVQIARNGCELNYVWLKLLLTNRNGGKPGQMMAPSVRDF